MTGQPPEPSAPEPRPAFRRSPTAERPRWSGPLLGLLLAVAAAGAAGYALTRPHLVFTNQLAGSVRLILGTGPPRTILPGETVRQSLARGGSTVAQWSLVRPLSANERPMGSEVRGSLVLREPRGTIERRAAARGPDADYFAPLITNSSNDELRIVVNAGLEGSLDCGCAVRPGGRRVFIGYYPLYQNSTVRARTRDGRTATFRDLGPKVTSPDGSVGLRFVPGDLGR